LNRKPNNLRKAGVLAIFYAGWQLQYRRLFSNDKPKVAMKVKNLITTAVASVCAFMTGCGYRNLYKWTPTFKDGKVSTDKIMPVEFLNGEKYWIPTQFDEVLENKPKHLPKQLQFGAGPEDLFYIIEFEPFELMDAFDRLGANGEKVY